MALSDLSVSSIRSHPLRYSQRIRQPQDRNQSDLSTTKHLCTLYINYLLVHIHRFVFWILENNPEQVHKRPYGMEKDPSYVHIYHWEFLPHRRHPSSTPKARGDGVETPFECPPPRDEESHHVDTGYYPYKQVQKQPISLLLKIYIPLQEQQ